MFIVESVLWENRFSETHLKHTIVRATMVEERIVVQRPEQRQRQCKSRREVRSVLCCALLPATFFVSWFKIDFQFYRIARIEHFYIWLSLYFYF